MSAEYGPVEGITHGRRWRVVEADDGSLTVKTPCAGAEATVATIDQLDIAMVIAALTAWRYEKPL